MANSFWNFLSRFVPGTTVRAEPVNDQFDGITAAFDAIESELGKRIKLPTTFTGNAALPESSPLNSLISINSAGDMAFYALGPFDAAVADTLAKHTAVVGMHGDVVTRSNDVTTKHTQINGWRATIEAQHTAVNGWHSAVSGWRNEVATWHPQVQGWRNEVSTWRNEVSTWRGQVLSSQADVSTKHTAVSGWHGQVSTWQAQVAANRALAEAWANNAEDLPISGVTPTAYSARHWALKAQAIAGGTAPNSLQLVGIPGANFYHTGNKPTPEAIGALPTTGVAADSVKLGNKLASEYALKSELAALVGNEFEGYSETRTPDALHRLRVNAGSGQFDFTPYYGGAYQYGKQLYFDVTNQRWAFDETPYVGNSAIWHAGNHGPGSGLNADTVDGRHANGFMLSEAGDYSSDAVPWNAQSGVYRNLHSGWQSLIAHFRAPDGSTPAMQLKSTYRNGGLWYRSSRDWFGFEDDWAQVATGNLPFQFWGNNYVDFGPNANWGGMLRVGGNGRTDATKATVCATDGSIHIDPKAGHHLFLNYYGVEGARTYFQRGGHSYFLASNGDINASVISAQRFASGADHGIDFSMMCTNWFRSVGASGWYNQTYGGGIYMEDTTWIRTTGGKKLHCNNDERNAIDTAGGFNAHGGQAFNYAGKCAFGGVNDSWLRLNPYGEFSSGIYCGTSILQTDAGFHVGSGGSSFKADATGAFVGGNTVIHAGNNPCGQLVWAGSANNILSINLPDGLYAVRCYVGDAGGYRVTFILEVDRSMDVTKSSSYHDPNNAASLWEYVSYQAATNTLYYAGDSSNKQIYKITRIY